MRTEDHPTAANVTPRARPPAQAVHAPAPSPVPDAPDPDTPDLPGCRPISLRRRDLDTWDDRFEYWDGATETAWVVRDPTGLAHEEPTGRLEARRAGRHGAGRSLVPALLPKREPSRGQGGRTGRRFDGGTGGRRDERQGGESGEDGARDAAAAGHRGLGGVPGEHARIHGGAGRGRRRRDTRLRQRGGLPGPHPRRLTARTRPPAPVRPDPKGGFALFVTY